MFTRDSIRVCSSCCPCCCVAGLIHLAMNMWTLYRIGPDLEREFGVLKVFVIYIASGVSGIVASAIFIPEVVGVGASVRFNRQYC
jgi:hypothetical protein